MRGGVGAGGIVGAELSGWIGMGAATGAFCTGVALGAGDSWASGSGA